MLDVSRTDSVQCTTALEVELLAAWRHERNLRLELERTQRQPAPPPPPAPEPEPPRKPMLVEAPAPAVAVNTHRLPPARVIAGTATLHQIQAAVSEQFKIPLTALKGQRRTREIMIARQVAYLLCATLTGASLPAIGRIFGNRDHTTVLHACRKLRWLEKALNEELTPADTLQTWAKGAHRIVVEKSNKWLHDPELQDQPKPQEVIVDIKALREA